MRGNEIAVTETDYSYVEKVFATFGCRTLGDYHDPYLKCDTLLLPCVVEDFLYVMTRTSSIVITSMSSNLCGDALFKISDADLELLTDRKRFEMAEKLIRGGVATEKILHS